MKTTIYGILASSILVLPASAIEPIPGSLNYVQQPAQYGMHKAPVGSVTFKQVHYRGHNYREVYRVGPTGDFELVSRTLVSD